MLSIFGAASVYYWLSLVCTTKIFGRLRVNDHDHDHGPQKQDERRKIRLGVRWSLSGLSEQTYIRTVWPQHCLMDRVYS